VMCALDAGGPCIVPLDSKTVALSQCRIQQNDWSHWGGPILAAAAFQAAFFRDTIVHLFRGRQTRKCHPRHMI